MKNLSCVELDLSFYANKQDELIDCVIFCIICTFFKILKSIFFFLSHTSNNYIFNALVFSIFYNYQLVSIVLNGSYVWYIQITISNSSTLLVSLFTVFTSSLDFYLHCSWSVSIIGKVWLSLIALFYRVIFKLFIYLILGNNMLSNVVVL